MFGERIVIGIHLNLKNNLFSLTKITSAMTTSTMLYVQLSRPWPWPVLTSYQCCYQYLNYKGPWRCQLIIWPMLFSTIFCWVLRNRLDGGPVLTISALSWAVWSMSQGWGAGAYRFSTRWYRNLEIWPYRQSWYPHKNFYWTSLKIQQLTPSKPSSMQVSR